MYKANYQIITLEEKGFVNQNRLSVLDNLQKYMGKIKRIYTMQGDPVGYVRGNHAHKKLQQLVIVTAGSYEFKLIDVDAKREKITLDTSRALHITGKIWRSFAPLEPSSSMIVLCSQEYDQSDYIFSYEEFLSYGQSK